jgi:hypothetical protein
MAIGGKTLTVYLAADVSKLRSGLNSADRSLSGFGRSLNSMVGPALIGATAAAGAFAVSLAVDGVQAAIQEEAELAKLSTTLNNLGFGAQTEQVNAFIDELQFSAAVSDSTLRPAMSRLLTSVDDVTQAQNLLKLALDVSAGTGKSLEAVTNALGKAYDGNLGALGKLGAGIDAQTIKSKDLDGALSQLSSTFAGQASTSANTLQGELAKTSIAFDELKEAIGQGILEAFGSGTKGISGLSEGIRTFTPAAKEGAKAATVLGTAIVAGPLESMNYATKTGGIIWTFNKAIQFITGSTDDSTDAIIANAQALSSWNNTALVLDKYVRGGYSGIPASTMFNSLDTWREKQEALLKPVKATAVATGGMAKAAKEMDPALRRQIDLVKDLTTKVGDAGKALQAARDDMNEWISSMSGNILSGIDLGTIQQFDDEGKRTGQSLLDGFQKQIDQAGLFGNYLKQLNSEGGPELRDAVAKLGPEAGNKLAKEIIDQGLIPTMQSKLVDVQHMAETTASEMVPPMLVAGVQSAAGYLMTMQAELDESSALLAEMGARMGKTLSDAMVKEIRDALAAAGFAQSGASATLAGTATQAGSGMAQAQIIAGSPFLNGTSIAQAISRAIEDSNQRLGRTGQVVLQ